MKLIKFLNDNKYIIIVIILIIYLFFIYERVEGFQVNERYDFKLSRLENLMEKFIKKLLVSEKDCRGRFTKYSECNKKCGFNSVQTRKYEILKKAEKDGKKCPYEDGYTETINCYMNRCEIDDPCEDNLDCESDNCKNGKCKEWTECSFNDLNMCNKTECKQLNEDKNFTNDEEGYYLYDNRINSCFFKTPAEIEDEEIKVYSYEYNSIAPVYKSKDCRWYEKKNEDDKCVPLKETIKLSSDDKPICDNSLMGPKPSPYNINESCSKCILDGTKWDGVQNCNCSSSGEGYENQYITSSDNEGSCLKINTDNTGQDNFLNCENTTFIGYSDRKTGSGADPTSWSDKYKYRNTANNFDPCVSISDPRYANTSSSPQSFYNKIVNNFDGADFYKGALKVTDGEGNSIKYSGSATEFTDLKTAQKFCNSLVYKNHNTGELSRCGFVLGYGYMNGYSPGVPMSASIVGNCNSELTYNVNYIEGPGGDPNDNKGQTWSNKIGINPDGKDINGPRSRMPLKCSSNFVPPDNVCPFYLDKGSNDSKKNMDGNGDISGKKEFDSWNWNTGFTLQNNVDCSKIPALFCEYTTYWDETNRKPCKLIGENCSNSPDSPNCEYPVSEYCMSAIKHYNSSGKDICNTGKSDEVDLQDLNKNWTDFKGYASTEDKSNVIFTEACMISELENYKKNKCLPDEPSEEPSEELSEECKAAIDIYQSPPGKDLCEDLFNNPPFNQKEGPLFEEFLKKARKDCWTPGQTTGCCNNFPEKPDPICDAFFKVIRLEPNKEMYQEVVNKYLMDLINKDSETNICTEEEVKNYRKLKSCSDWESQTS